MMAATTILDRALDGTESALHIFNGTRNPRQSLVENSTVNVPSHQLNWTMPEGCVELQFDNFVPWGNEDNLISAETEVWFERLKAAWFLPVLFLINMLVFFKQGLSERINVCLFALSLADELYLVQCMFLNAERMHTQFTSGERYGPIFQFIANHNLVGFFGFTWVSQLVSAIIASERCFCIVSPLHSQTVLKTRTTAIFIAISSTAIVGIYFAVATRYRVICVFDPHTNTNTKMLSGSEFYYQHKEIINYLDSVVYGVLIPGMALTTVTITTVITAVKLHQTVTRRAEMSSCKISPREVALTKMLISNSILFIVCVLPISLFRFILFFVPELNTGGRYHNTFLAVLWLLEIVSYINSSFNFFVYYTMGSRYRDTCKKMFCKGKCTRQGNTSTETEN